MLFEQQHWLCKDGEIINRVMSLVCTSDTRLETELESFHPFPSSSRLSTPNIAATLCSFGLVLCRFYLADCEDTTVVVAHYVSANGKEGPENGSIHFEVCKDALVEADGRWPESDRLHSTCGVKKYKDERHLLRPNRVGRHSCGQARSLDRNEALQVPWCLGSSRRRFRGCIKLHYCNDPKSSPWSSRQVSVALEA